jgi:agmatinase
LKEKMAVLSDASNFLGSREFSGYQESKFVVQSLPFERTSSYITGSELGPQAILKASHFVEFFDEELKKDTRRAFGISTLSALSFENLDFDDSLNEMEEATAKHTENHKFLVTLGAEHTITLPVFKGLQKKYKDLSILQLDAHADLRESYEGNKYSHACVMARIKELNPKIVQVGIRAFCEEEQTCLDANLEQILSYTDFQIKGDSIPVQPVLNHLTNNVYVTIDTDGFSPHLAPEVGTLEPGGLEWHQSLSFLKEVFRNKNVVGFDIVECCPKEDPSPTAYVLAKLAYKLMGYASLNPYNSILYP